MSARAALLALALATAPSAAGAQSLGSDVDIVGDWSFKTDVYPYDCQMSGELSLQATEDPGVYEGELVAREDCKGTGPFHAEQLSVARRDGDRLVIESELVRVLPSPDYYLPDNFVLTIVDGALMVGELRSADVAPVTFRRGADLVS